MNVLVLNAGSSSVKFKVFEFGKAKQSARLLLGGLVERIGETQGAAEWEIIDGNQSTEHKTKRPFIDHEAALDFVNMLIDKLGAIDLVGHRMVHGGSTFTAPTLITQEVLDTVSDLSNLAPLHNPHNLLGVKTAMKVFKSAIQVAVFDTAFHQSMPSHTYRYALPTKCYEQYQMRAYGFHGTSHQYVSRKAIEMLDLVGKPSKVIVAHLGNGCSISAVKDGKSIDTSMGMAPTGGLMMGTRSGDIDVTISTTLMLDHGYSAQQVANLLNKESGLLGVAGNNDFREVSAAYEAGDPKAVLAIDMYAQRLKKYIGSYAAVLGGVDALVFTAGVGENSDLVRRLTCEGLDFLGLTLDQELNKKRSKEARVISKATASSRVLVVPTNEELEISQQAIALAYPNS